mmetsp:Transcript_120394/g.341100  ORF Transcript_120394/g.341100 Transcript_120394/m.341100 type:complete len:239 (-) Transcript_120394:114-830(-)
MGRAAEPRVPAAAAKAPRELRGAVRGGGGGAGEPHAPGHVEPLAALGGAGELRRVGTAGRGRPRRGARRQDGLPVLRRPRRGDPALPRRVRDARAAGLGLGLHRRQPRGPQAAERAEPGGDVDPHRAGRGRRDEGSRVARHAGRRVAPGQKAAAPPVPDEVEAQRGQGRQGRAGDPAEGARAQTAASRPAHGRCGALTAQYQQSAQGAERASQHRGNGDVRGASGGAGGDAEQAAVGK